MQVAADYFRQAMKGLEYLHYHKVVHGDIKPGARRAPVAQTGAALRARLFPHRIPLPRSPA